MSRRVGRPAVERPPNERVPVGLRLRGSLYNRLIELASKNDRPLANEVEMLLERALNPPIPYEELREALTLLAIKRQGCMPFVRYLITVDGNPDQKEQERRRRLISSAAANPSPSAEWLTPDKPRYIDEYDENLNLVSRVDLDDDGNPIPATGQFKK